MSALRSSCLALVGLALSVLSCASTAPTPAEQGTPATVATPAPAKAKSFEGAIAAFEATDRQSPPPRDAILFIGSSSIRFWTTLAADFPRHTVINRGFGGSHIEHSVAYVNRIVVPYAPRAIVMYAGGNDLNAGKLPADVAMDFEAFVRAVHAALPRTRIAYISVGANPARWAQAERIKELNQLITAFTQTDPRLSFIDVFPHMLGPDGRPRPDIFVADRVHMNPAGYKIWVGVIAPCLDRLAAPVP